MLSFQLRQYRHRLIQQIFVPRGHLGNVTYLHLWIPSASRLLLLLLFWQTRHAKRFFFGFIGGVTMHTATYRTGVCNDKLHSQTAPLSCVYEQGRTCSAKSRQNLFVAGHHKSINVRETLQIIH